MPARRPGPALHESGTFQRCQGAFASGVCAVATTQSRTSELELKLSDDPGPRSVQSFARCGRLPCGTCWSRSWTKRGCPRTHATSRARRWRVSHQTGPSLLLGCDTYSECRVRAVIEFAGHSLSGGVCRERAADLAQCSTCVLERVMRVIDHADRSCTARVVSGICAWREWTGQRPSRRGRRGAGPPSRRATIPRQNMLAGGSRDTGRQASLNRGNLVRGLPALCRWPLGFVGPVGHSSSSVNPPCEQSVQRPCASPREPYSPCRAA